MSIQASSMSGSGIPSSGQVRPGSSLPRKLLLLFLVVIITSIGLVIQIKQRPGSPPLYLTILTDLILGLVAGLSARIFLRRRHGLIRFLAAIAGLVVGLFIIGFFTRARVGFAPIPTSFFQKLVPSFNSSQFWRSAVNWFSMAQLAIGAGTLSLALMAWPGTVRTSLSVAPAAAAHVQPQPRVSSRPQTKVRAKRPARSKKKIATKSQPALFPIVHKPSPPKSSVKPAKVDVSKKSKSSASGSSRRRLFQRKPEVHLSQLERHICPYCLEPVTRNDPRGVVECDICHTLHHADCWEIAGACQVPHYTP